MDEAGPEPLIDALQYADWTRAHFADWHAAGLAAVHVTVAYHEGARETLTRLADWNQRFRDHADLIRPVRAPEDLAAARREGRVGVILGAQNPSPIENEAGLVQVLRDAGLAVMQLTYNNLSLLGAGCAELDDPGLSRMGREVLREMNRAGMLVDIAHAGERTQLDAIEQAARPVALTHGNPRFFHDSPRGTAAPVLRALAETGGMMGFSLYVRHLAGEARCTRRQFAEMVARTAEIMGPEHLGIGSDLCRGWGGETIDWMRNGRWRLVPETERAAHRAAGWPAQPEWFQRTTDLHGIAAELREVGFQPREVAGIMGGNWARFFSKALAADTADTARAAAE